MAATSSSVDEDSMRIGQQLACQPNWSRSRPPTPHVDFPSLEDVAAAHHIPPLVIRDGRVESGGHEANPIPHRNGEVRDERWLGHRNRVITAAPHRTTGKAVHPDDYTYQCQGASIV